MLIQLIVVLIVVGVLLWAVTQFPIDPMLQNVIRVVVIVAVVLWLASVLLGYSPAVGTGPHRLI